MSPPLRVVVAEDDGARAIELARANAADIVLSDVEMPGTTGLDLCRELRDEMTVVLLTRHARPGLLEEALQAGAAASVTKATPIEEVARIMRAAHAGQRYVDPAIAAAALSNRDTCPLTTREVDVLRISLTDVPVAAIADELHLAEGTVRNYLSSAMTALGARNRHEAARVAEAAGWLEHGGGLLSG